MDVILLRLCGRFTTRARDVHRPRHRRRHRHAHRHRSCVICYVPHLSSPLTCYLSTSLPQQHPSSDGLFCIPFLLRYVTAGTLPKVAAAHSPPTAVSQRHRNAPGSSPLHHFRLGTLARSYSVAVEPSLSLMFTVSGPKSVKQCSLLGHRLFGQELRQQLDIYSKSFLFVTSETIVPLQTSNLPASLLVTQ